MKNPMIDLKKMLEEWKKQVEEAKQKESDERARLIGRIESMEERIKELEIFRDHMEGFDE